MKSVITAVACGLLLLAGCAGTSTTDKDLGNLPVGAQQTISGGPGVLWGDEKIKLNANFAEVANLQTLSGVPAASTSLGVFTGVTITDNATIKAAFQSLETALESGGGGTMIYPGAGIPLSTGSAWGTSYSLDIDLTTVSAGDDTIPSAKAVGALYDSLPVLTFTGGLTETAGTVTVTPDTYQPLLVSGVNVKTINGVTLLGSGDMTITGSAPTVQADDPTSASATGWYVATTSGDLFYKSDAGLFTVAGSYAADPATTIFDESFDTATGLDNTWASFAADPDYATAPAPLVGTQSASVDMGESGRDAVTWTSTYNIDYLVRFDAIDNATDSELFNLRDSGAVVIGRLYLTADDKLKARQGATTETSIGTIAANTTYHIWLEYTPATSGDGVMAVWLTEYTGSETKPGTVFVQESAGGSAAVPIDFVLMHTVETGGNITIDEVKIW